MKKILLVDDKPELLVSGKEIFEAGGYEVVTACNGAEALALIAIRNFDLVVTDVVMPVMNGYSLCYAIRTGGHQNDVPVIIYSASFIKPRHRELGLEVGANIFIPKQNSRDYLLQATEKIFSTEGTPEWRFTSDLSAPDVLRQYEIMLIRKMESNDELFFISEEADVIKGESLFRALVEHSNDMISLVDENGIVLYHSPAALRLLGYDSTEAVGMQAINFFHPEDQADVIARLQMSLERPGEPIFRSNRMLHRDGHFIWTEGITTNLLHDPNVRAFVGNFREITERMIASEKTEQNEKRIEAERKKFSDLFEQAPSYICILSGPDLVYEMANPLYLQITGKKDIIGKKAKEVFPELEAQGFVELIFNVYHTGVPFAANEVPITIKNDETGLMVEHYMNFVYQPYRDEDGNVAGIFFFANLVTDMVKAREEISVKERRFRALVENGSDAVVILDANGAPIYLSPSVEKLLGYADDEIKTLDLFAITHPDDIEEVKRGMQEIFANPGVVFEGRVSRLKHKNGTWRWYEATLTNMLHSPLINGIVDNFRDITDRKIAEEERAKIINDIVQRNKNLEQFSYIVSHNLRSPVANIIGLANVLKDADIEYEGEMGLIEDIVFSAKKLDGVISDLNYILQARHAESKQKELVALADLVNDIKLSIDNLIKSNDVEIITDFSAIDEMFTLKSYMYSIIYNLVSNSIKYRRADVSPILHIASEIQGNKVVLTFEDNGLGIDLVRRKDEIFGLYKRFHTHVNGKGMGLFMVKTEVESLGGTISVESEINKGTKFRIEFDRGGE